LDVNRRAIAEGDHSFPPVYEDVAAQAMLGNRERGAGGMGTGGNGLAEARI
jgi:hypothetical protein